MSLRNDAKAQSAESNSAPQETFISTDLTDDFEAGIQFVDARVKAFGAGVNYRMAQVQDAMACFAGAKFVIANATYQRPALPPSDEEVKQSVMALLYTPSPQVEEVA